MSALDGRIKELDERTFSFVEKNFAPVQEAYQETAASLNYILDFIRQYEVTGVLGRLNFNNLNKSPPQTGNGIAIGRSSSKENIVPEVAESPKQRPKRNAFREASLNIGAQTSSRPRRGPQDKVLIKQEKRSTNTLKVKQEKDEEDMPPPARAAPKKKTRKAKVSKVQVKQEKIEDNGRESDVIVQDPVVPVVNLDSDDEPLAKTQNKPRKTGKRTRRDSDKEPASLGKRSKSNEAEEIGNCTSHTLYEDAVDTAEVQAANATFVPTSPINKHLVPNMNATVVVDKPKIVNKPKTIDDLLTDDESEDEKAKPTTKTKIPKQVFSPFVQSPVKQKVEAFEKLRQDASAIPMRVTRTKTKAQAKEQDEDGEQPETKSNVKEKAKLFTPNLTRFMPGAASTASKSAQRLPSNNESLLSTKSVSALKASQAEFREREKRRREKEQEAQKKREALLLAHTEEKKKKREEKQLKAQQQREALEKEKLKVLEAQRLKDERHKQILAEQEERKLKLKEDLEKKRMMVKNKAIEEKKKEEQRRLEEHKKEKELTKTLAKHDCEIAEMVQKHKSQMNKPIYLKTPPPLLPSNDCYDSDDESRDRNAMPVQPAWFKTIDKILYCIDAAKDQVKNSFFSRKAQSADLREIFEVIDPQKLKRSSSAIWHKPPRYTMLHGTLGSHDETEEFLEDSDED